MSTIGLAAWMKLGAAAFSRVASTESGSAAPICQLAGRPGRDKGDRPCRKRFAVHAAGGPVAFGSQGRVPDAQAETASKRSPPSGMFRWVRHSDKKRHTVNYTHKIYGKYMFFGPHEHGSINRDRHIVRARLFEEMVAA
ncbi:MAG: hypothetical protein L0I29_09485 [Hyphomicrobiales bacterium]|nr:hypothetical protein [Hyphomicrobiales bacterium]